MFGGERSMSGVYEVMTIGLLWPRQGATAIRKNVRF